MGIVCMVPPSLGAAKASARAELLASALQRDLSVEVRMEVATNYGELERHLNEATVDIAWCPAAVCARLTRATAFFSVVREGVSSYRSALIARREDRLNLLQLDGKRAAWVDPLSAGGYLLAEALLKSRGLESERVFASQAFLGTHRAVALAVLQNDADVGAVSIHGVHDNALEAMMRWYVGPNGDRLETIAVSERCPNDALVLSSRLPSALTAQLIEIASKAHEGPKARRSWPLSNANGCSKRSSRAISGPLFSSARGERRCRRRDSLSRRGPRPKHWAAKVPRRLARIVSPHGSSRRRRRRGG